jgi:hypothetical protein
MDKIYSETCKIVEEMIKEESKREYKNYLERRRMRKESICFVCGEKGHKARECARRECVRTDSVEDVCVIEKKVEVNRQNVKVNKIESVVEDIDRQSKRGKYVDKLEVLVEKYPEVFSQEQEKVKYLTGF